MCANVAAVTKISENTIRFLIMVKEKGGVPRRKDLIKSAPLLSGLSSAKVTKGCGITPSFPRVCIKDNG